MRTGSYAALMTLFDDDGEVDLAATRAHVERLVASGLDGILVCGSTSEFPALSDDERAAIAEAALEAAAGRVAVAVHVGTPSTRATVRLARHAAQAGADALAAVTPFYLRTDADGLRGHLEAVKEVAPELPLLAYSIARLAGYDHPIELLAELAGRGVVQGVKESGDELTRLLALRAACGEGFLIFAGAPALQAACLAHGGDGTILGVTNLAPEICVEIARHARAGDHGAAAACVRRRHPAAMACGIGTFPAGLKELCAARFGSPPHVRAPRRALTAAEHERALAGLAAAGLAATATA